MYCSNCGKENPDGAHFCAQCGHPLKTIPGDDPKDKKKKNRWIIPSVSAIVAVAVLAVLGYRFVLPNISADRGSTTPQVEGSEEVTDSTPQPVENASEQGMATGQTTDAPAETEDDEYSLGVEGYNLLNAYYTGDYDDYNEIESSLYDLLDRMYTELGEDNDLVRLATSVEQAIYDGNTPLVLDVLNILKNNCAEKTADAYNGLPFVEDNVIELTRYEQYNTGMVIDLNTGYYGLYDHNTSEFLYYPNESCYDCGADMISIEKDGYYGSVYYSGESAIGCYYEEPLRFNKNGLSAVKSNGMYGAIDKTGQKILPTQYTEVDFVGDSFLVANTKNSPSENYPELNQFAIFDNLGNQITDHDYASFTIYEDKWLLAEYNSDSQLNTSDDEGWYNVFDLSGNRLIGVNTTAPDVWGVSYPDQFGMMVGISNKELVNQYGESFPVHGPYFNNYGYKYLTPDLCYLNDDVYSQWYHSSFNANGYAVASLDRNRRNDDLRVVIDLNGNEVIKLSENYGDYYMIVDANDYVCVMGYNAATIDPATGAVFIIETREMYTYAKPRLIEGTNMVIVQDPSTELYGLYDGPELALDLEYTSIYYDYGRECVVATRGAESEDYYSSYTDLRVNALLNHEDAAGDASTASADLIINYANLNARSEPNTNSEILGEFSTGTIMEYASHNDGWYEVSYNGQTCYVSGNYVISTTKERINNGSVGLLTTTTNVEIMAGPGTRFVVSGREDAGYDMVYDGTVDNYYRVIYDDDYAYVPTYAVEIIDCHK